MMIRTGVCRCLQHVESEVTVKWLSKRQSILTWHHLLQKQSWSRISQHPVLYHPLPQKFPLEPSKSVNRAVTVAIPVSVTLPLKIVSLKSMTGMTIPKSVTCNREFVTGLGIPSCLARCKSLAGMTISKSVTCIEDLTFVMFLGIVMLSKLQLQRALSKDKEMCLWW